jgi:hypothetical protein
MKKRRFIAKLLLIVLFISLNVFAHEQNDKLFSCIPKSKRMRLIDKLNLFIRYNKNLQFSNLYDMFASAFVLNQHLDKESYVKFNERLVLESNREVLIEFKPYEVTKSQLVNDNCSEEYDIRGISKYSIRGKIYTAKRLVVVCYQEKDNDWYFTDFLEEIID